MPRSSPPPTQRIPSLSQPTPSSAEAAARAIPETTRADSKGGVSLMRLPSALSESYTIIEHLPTKGAEADIFLVEHRPTGIKNIVKVYRRNIECKPDLLERLRGLDGRHVVQLIDHGKSDGHWFELMEYLPLGTLDTYMNRHAKLSDETCRAVLKELLNALNHLHANGIFHRDLKPENILVREESPLRLVFSDFGIASLSDATVCFTRGAGTLHYAAPEQIVAAATVTGKTDYWSLGMILYEMLAGQNPFNELGEYAIASAIATGSTGTGNIVPFEKIADPKWRILCQGLLVRDPMQRWGGDEVGRWLRGDETLNITTEKRNIAYRPYIFNQNEYYNHEELACAFASDWGNAIKHLQRGYLTSWFSRELMNQDLAVFIDDLIEDTSISQDIRLHKLLLEMNPDISPNWKGLKLTKKNISAVAREVLRGSSEKFYFIEDLYKYKMFVHPTDEIDNKEMDWRAEVYFSWKSKKNDIEIMLNRLINNKILKYIDPEKIIMNASLLLSCIEDNFQEEIKNEYLRLIEERGVPEYYIDEIFNGVRFDFSKHFLIISGIDYIEKYIKNEIHDKIKSILSYIYSKNRYVIENINYCNEKYKDLSSVSKDKKIYDLEKKLSALNQLELKLKCIAIDECKYIIKNIIDNNKILMEKIPKFKSKINKILISVDSSEWEYTDLFMKKIKEIEKNSRYFNDFFILVDEVLDFFGKKSFYEYELILKIINDSLISLQKENIDVAIERCESLKREWLIIGIM